MKGDLVLTKKEMIKFVCLKEFHDKFHNYNNTIT